MLIIWAFDYTKKKYTWCRREDYLKKFCTFLREHATNVNNFEKKKMLPLTTKELKLHQDATTECYIYRKRFLVC